MESGRVLLILGYSHSAYTFSHESMIYNSSLIQSDIQPGLLLDHLKNSLQYEEVESHVLEVYLGLFRMEKKKNVNYHLNF